MSEMVERVARGIHLRRPNSRRTKWEDCSDEYRTGTMRDAHAAIEAMREPTEAMLSEYFEGKGRDTFVYHWQKGIDAALK